MTTSNNRLLRKIMNKTLITISILSCLSGIIGFIFGGAISYFYENVKLQKIYDMTNTCLSLSETSLGRDNPAYMATIYYEIINTDDQELKDGFADMLKPQLIQYAAELKIAIDKAEDDNGQGINLYKDTLSKIESLIGIEAHNNKTTVQNP